MASHRYNSDAEGGDMQMIELPERSFYLASYPRSGNTWMLYSLGMLLPVIKSEARSAFDLFPFEYRTTEGEGFFLRAEREFDPQCPLMIKTHEPYDVCRRVYPRRPSIYIYRDGRDVMTSYYFYYKAFADRNSMIVEKVGPRQELTARTIRAVEFDPGEFSSFLRDHAAEWKAHVAAWHGKGDVYLVKYEELHNRFSSILEEIVARLGISPACTVSAVRESYVDQFRQYFSDNNQAFFRKGVVGDWTNYFTEEHVRIFGEETGEFLATLGYETVRA